MVCNTSIEKDGPESPQESKSALIAAIVVTFNRKKLLEECLDALMNQTRPVDKIFIVDQGSTDGTWELLKERKFLSHSQVEYSRAEVNSGGAGGFHRGMRMAYDAGFHWVWVMDDDAIPDQDALRNMMPHTRKTGVVGVANLKLRIDGSVDSRHIEYEKLQSTEPEESEYLQYSSFVGLMISSTGIDLAGLPRIEFFFQQDDVEYCRRLVGAGKIVLARDATITHKEAARVAPVVRWFGRDFIVYATPEYCIRHYFHRRNYVWTQLHGRTIRIGDVSELILQAINGACKIAIMDRQDILLRMRIHCRAIADGVMGRFDNDYPFRMRAIAIARNAKNKY